MKVSLTCLFIGFFWTTLCTEPLNGNERIIHSSGPALNLQQSKPLLNDQNLNLKLTFIDLLKTGNDLNAGLSVDLDCWDNRWRPGRGSAPRYNQGQHLVLVSKSDVRLTVRTITASVQVQLNPDRWAPAEAKPEHLEISFEGQLQPITCPKIAPYTVEGQFWTIEHKSHGESYYVTGTYKSNFRGQDITGKISGSIGFPEKPGHWNMGNYQDDTLAFKFDLGSERRNWNHARMAKWSAEAPLDWSAFDGLKIKIDTDKPRLDTAVSIWLGEGDGSWYYVQDAVPLSAHQNEAILLFEDFSEAEWMAPPRSNHMDEDYVLDLKELHGLCVGVANSLGVGRVDFSLVEIEPVKIKKTPLAPAKIVVDGSLRVVNGHDKVPYGLFGGYAPDLPQKYRPGCQRQLSGAMNMPRMAHVKYRGHEIENWKSIQAKLLSTDVNDAARTECIRTLLDPRIYKRISEWNEQPDPKTGRIRKPEQEVANTLNALLTKNELLTEALWPDLEWPSETVKPWKVELENLKPVERLELGRHLFDRWLKPAVSQHLMPFEHFYINCYGERYQTATLITNSNWKDIMRADGRDYASKAKANGYQAHFEFWNEPYLNWAERSRKNYQTPHYRLEDAVIGGPVSLKYATIENPAVIPHLSWRKNAQGELEVYDPTAFSYWSGRGNGWIYDQMYGEIASAIKAENPDVRCIAGWGFRWHEDHWAPWELLYKPTIDRNIDYIDAIHEHHYQGDTTAMNGSYEMLVGYAKMAHNKWLYIYNTETNDLVDAPARGAVNTPEKAARAKDYRRMVYNTRDILYCILQSPDKAYARTVIHCDHTPLGTDVAYGMLKNLRGRLLHTISDDSEVWCVGSIDGTDPQAMPETAGFRYVVAVFNEHRKPREIEIEVQAPVGTHFRTGSTTLNYFKPETFELGTAVESVEPNGRNMLNFRLKLEPRMAWVLELPLSGNFDNAPEIHSQQYFSDRFIELVQPDKSLVTQIALPAEILNKATEAFLRVVVEKVAPGEALVDCNGQVLTLPAAYTAENNNRILELPLDLKNLKTINHLEFSVNHGNYRGYRLVMSSIVLRYKKTP